MRPMKLALALAAVAALLPAASLAQPLTCAEQGGTLFVDKIGLDKGSFEFNTSCSDAEGVDYCLSGRAAAIDGTVTPNRLVQFDWFSDGSVTKSSDNATKGEFSDVTLILTIFIVRSPSDANNCTIWQSAPATFDCKLKGGTRKANTQSRVRLLCDLGNDLSGLVPDPQAFPPFPPITDVPSAQPLSPQTLLESVQSAFLKRRNMKVNVTNGRLKVSQRGVDAPTNFQNFLMCPAVPPAVPQC